MFDHLDEMMHNPKDLARIEELEAENALLGEQVASLKWLWEAEATERDRLREEANANHFYRELVNLRNENARLRAERDVALAEGVARGAEERARLREALNDIATRDHRDCMDNCQDIARAALTEEQEGSEG